MLLQIVSDGRLVRISWSDGTMGGGRACLAVAASGPPLAADVASASRGVGSGVVGVLDLDLNGFHAGLGVASGAGPLSAGLVPSAFGSPLAVFGDYKHRVLISTIE